MNEPDEMESTMAFTVLQGVEAVRRRPSMYLRGDSDADRLHELIGEIVRAAASPSSRNGARNVRITVYKDEGIKIVDDGVGIPVEPVEYSGVHHPRLHVMMLTLFAGGKPAPEFFDLWGYLFITGPLLVALSTKLTIRTIRNGTAYRASFEEGGLTGLLSKAYGTAEERGTRVTFTPSKTIFGGATIDFRRLQETIAQVRPQAPGVEIILNADPTCHWD